MVHGESNTVRGGPKDRYRDRSTTAASSSGVTPSTSVTALDDVVERLRDIERRSGFEKTLAIGELLLARFFGSDPSAWQDRRRNKNTSIRRLAQRADCPFSKSALSNALAIYVASSSMPCVRQLAHVTASHLGSVLGLPQVEQERLLLVAERERWSVRRLKGEVTSLKRDMGERRGRPVRSVREHASRTLNECVQQLRSVLHVAQLACSSNTRLSDELRSIVDELVTLALDLKRTVEANAGMNEPAREASSA